MGVILLEVFFEGYFNTIHTNKRTFRLPTVKSEINVKNSDNVARQAILDEVSTLIARCGKQPQERPSFTIILRVLEKLAQTFYANDDKVATLLASDGSKIASLTSIPNFILRKCDELCSQRITFYTPTEELKAYRNTRIDTIGFFPRINVILHCKCANKFNLIIKKILFCSSNNFVNEQLLHSKPIALINQIWV